MKLISNILGNVSRWMQRPSDHDDYWYESRNRSPIGRHVSATSALQLSCVLACTSLIANTVGALPLIVYRKKDPSGERAPAVDEHLYGLLKTRPNPNQTPFGFKQQILRDVLLYGNAFVRISPGESGPVDSLTRLMPAAMSVLVLESGRLAYEFKSQSAKHVFLDNEIMHLKLYSEDGVNGLSPIDYQRETIGGALATQAFGSNFFGNISQPGLVIKHPANLSDDAAKNIQASFDRRLKGPNGYSTVVLDENMSLENVGLSHEQAQYLESRKYSNIDVCRMYNVPPSLVGEAEKGGTQASVEAQGQNFLTYTLQPYLRMVEEGINHALVLDPSLYCEFNTSSLVRADLTTRFAAYQVARTGGWMSANEIRQRENLPRRSDSGGDAFLDPLNYQRSDQPAVNTQANASALIARDGTPLRTSRSADFNFTSKRQEKSAPLSDEEGARNEHGKYLH